MARTRSIKVLDHALATEAGTDACVRFVEALGLKTLFSAFMRGSDSSQRKKSSRGATSAAEDEEHILGVLVSLFSNLDSDSAPRIRLLAKFVEDEYEKVDRLLELREAAEARVKGREGELAAERRVSSPSLIGAQWHDHQYSRQCSTDPSSRRLGIRPRRRVPSTPGCWPVLATDDRLYPCVGNDGRRRGECGCTTLPTSPPAESVVYRSGTISECSFHARTALSRMSLKF
jgi:hypothetical protein